MKSNLQIFMILKKHKELKGLKDVSMTQLKTLFFVNFFFANLNILSFSLLVPSMSTTLSRCARNSY